jgi:WD40 repeat protein
MPPVVGSVEKVSWSPDGTHIAWFDGRRFWVGRKDGSDAHYLAKRPDIDCCFMLWWARTNTLFFDADFVLGRVTTSGHVSLTRAILGSEFWVNRKGTFAATQSIESAAPVELIDLRRRNPRRYPVSPLGSATKLVADLDPTFSPDGQWVAFERSYCNGWKGPCVDAGIWKARVTGGHLRRLSPIGHCPSWSPRGHLLFVARRSFRLLDLRTGHARRLSRRVFADPNSPCMQADEVPLWSSDGKYVAYVVPGPDYTLRVLSMQTQRVRSFPGIGAVTQFAWSPTRRELLAVSTTFGGDPTCSTLWSIDGRDWRPRAISRCRRPRGRTSDRPRHARRGRRGLQRLGSAAAARPAS